jgi:hypothetical protein
MTSIELLIQQITLQYKKYYPDWEFPNKEFYIEMHKQEILDAFESGEDNIDNDGCAINKNGAESYYNETFKKDQ